MKVKKKIELIKEAYGKHYEKVKNLMDDDGWIEIDPFTLELTYNELYHSTAFTVDSKKVRPISLEGLEENNGWKKLNHYSDIINLQKPFLVYTDKGCVYTYDHYCGSFGISETQDIAMYKVISKELPMHIC